MVEGTHMTPVKLAIAGAAGRMGRRLIALSREDERLDCSAALETAGHPALGSDAGEVAGIGRIGVPISSEVRGGFDVLIEFSSPQGTLQWLDVAVQRGRAIVIGTTGHTKDQLSRIHDAASSIAIVKAANMSVGVNVLLRLVRQLAATLDDSYDVEIAEAHHRFKKDAPSGTALALRDAVWFGRGDRDGGQPERRVVFERRGEVGERPMGEVGMHSLRLGDTVGEHSVYFGNLGETIALSHSAHSRDTFALGALRAARWLAGRAPGLYDMQHVLFGESSVRG